jgi:hypothetical protein
MGLNWLMASLIRTSTVHRGDLAFHRLRTLVHHHPTDHLVAYFHLPHLRSRGEIRVQ